MRDASCQSVAAIISDSHIPTDLGSFYRNKLLLPVDTFLSRIYFLAFFLLIFLMFKQVDCVSNLMLICSSALTW